MAAELIGRCRCPFCKSDKAKLTLAKSGLPVMTCNGCNSQSFARSDVSDMHFRSMLIASSAAPAPAPAEPPQTAPAAQTAPPPAPPAPERKGMGWGVLR